MFGSGGGYLVTSPACSGIADAQFRQSVTPRGNVMAVGREEVARIPQIMAYMFLNFKRGFTYLREPRSI